VVALQSTLLAKRLKAPEPIKGRLPKSGIQDGAFFVGPISDSHFVDAALFFSPCCVPPPISPKTLMLQPEGIAPMTAIRWMRSCERMASGATEASRLRKIGEG